jgi:hypothetical protein
MNLRIFAAKRFLCYPMNEIEDERKNTPNPHIPFVDISGIGMNRC